MTRPRTAQDFLDVLSTYFADQSRDVGLSEIVSVSSRNPDFHGEMLATIDAAVAAADREEATILDTVRHRFLRMRRDDDAVREFLRDLRDQYLRLYAEALKR